MLKGGIITTTTKNY